MTNSAILLAITNQKSNYLSFCPKRLGKRQRYASMHANFSSLVVISSFWW